MSTSRTLFTVDGAVAFLTFNRPEARNAMTWDMYEALLEACDRVDRTEAVRVFVLRAEGKAFIAGTDISQFSRFASRDDAVAYERRIDSVIDRLERVSAATIAQVHGVAAGGGCAIALACDLRVCTADAQFGDTDCENARQLPLGGELRTSPRHDRAFPRQGPALHGPADRRHGSRVARAGHPHGRSLDHRRGGARSSRQPSPRTPR